MRKILWLELRRSFRDSTAFSLLLWLLFFGLERFSLPSSSLLEEFREVSNLIIVFMLIFSSFFHGNAICNKDFRERYWLFIFSIPGRRSAAWAALLLGRLVGFLGGLALMLGVRPSLVSEFAEHAALYVGLIAMPVLFAGGMVSSLLFRQTSFSYSLGFPISLILLFELFTSVANYSRLPGQSVSNFFAYRNGLKAQWHEMDLDLLLLIGHLVVWIAVILGVGCLVFSSGEFGHIKVRLKNFLAASGGFVLLLLITGSGALPELYSKLMSGKARYFNQVMVSPDGSYFVSVYMDPNPRFLHLKIADISSGKTRVGRKGAAIHDVFWSSDGAFIYVFEEDSSFLSLLGVRRPSGKLLVLDLEGNALFSELSIISILPVKSHGLLVLSEEDGLMQAGWFNEDRMETELTYGDLGKVEDFDEFKWFNYRSFDRKGYEDCRRGLGVPFKEGRVFVSFKNSEEPSRSTSLHLPDGYLAVRDENGQGREHALEYLVKNFGVPESSSPRDFGVYFFHSFKCSWFGETVNLFFYTSRAAQGHHEVYIYDKNSLEWTLIWEEETVLVEFRNNFSDQTFRSQGRKTLLQEGYGELGVAGYVIAGGMTFTPMEGGLVYESGLGDSMFVGRYDTRRKANLPMLYGDTKEVGGREVLWADKGANTLITRTSEMPRKCTIEYLPLFDEGKALDEAGIRIPCDVYKKMNFEEYPTLDKDGRLIAPVSRNLGVLVLDDDGRIIRKANLAGE